MHVETLSIRISKAERAALRARARQEKVSQGQLVRQALRAYGVAPKRQPALSAYATNPKYMEGFGR